MAHQSKGFFEECSTDRDHGEGFVLSGYRTSGAGKSKHIISNRIHAGSNGCMEGKLLGMCQYIDHVYKGVMTRGQMYNNNSCIATNFLL